MFDYKFILGGLAIAMTVAAHIPYFYTTVKGTNKPHIFTWVIWTLLTGIGFAGQVAGHGGPGSWATGVTGILCIAITAAALRKGEKTITRTDWAMFLAGLGSIALWAVTKDPLWSVIIVTCTDASAYYPTFRKSWVRPDEEHSFMYGFNIPRHVVAIAALRQISLTTALYPVMLLAMNSMMYVMLKTRRAKTSP
jgi:hypothetical protein